MPKMLSPQNLHRMPLFADLDQDVLNALALRSTEITVAKDACILEEGDVATNLYIILDGAVDIRVVTDATYQTHADVAELVTGDLIGWSALVEPYVYRMSAYAQKDTSLAKLKARDLHDIIDSYPDAGCVLMTRIVQIIAGRLTALRTRFVSLIEV